jgi:hypothetical protein
MRLNYVSRTLDNIFVEILGSDPLHGEAAGASARKDDERDSSHDCTATPPPAAAYVADHEQWCITRQVGNTEPCSCLGKVPDRAADFCEWTLRASGWEFDLYDACGDKPLRGMLTTQKRCHRCKKPIIFKEPTP